MPRSRSVLAFAGLAILTGLTLWSLAGPSSSDPAGPITTARGVMSLSPSEAEERRPVFLPEAVVPAFDPEMHVTFVQDATGGIYIECFKSRPSVKVGDRVRVNGLTGHGRRERIIES